MNLFRDYLKMMNLSKKIKEKKFKEILFDDKKEKK